MNDPTTPNRTARRRNCVLKGCCRQRFVTAREDFAGLAEARFTCSKSVTRDRSVLPLSVTNVAFDPYWFHRILLIGPIRFLNRANKSYPNDLLAPVGKFIKLTYRTDQGSRRVSNCAVRPAWRFAGLQARTS